MQRSGGAELRCVALCPRIWSSELLAIQTDIREKPLIELGQLSQGSQSMPFPRHLPQGSLQEHEHGIARI
jgi:hypothetical protein